MKKIYVAIVILVLLGLSLYLMEGDKKGDEKDDICDQINEDLNGICDDIPFDECVKCDRDGGLLLLQSCNKSTNATFNQCLYIPDNIPEDANINPDLDFKHAFCSSNINATYDDCKSKGYEKVYCDYNPKAKNVTTENKKCTDGKSKSPGDNFTTDKFFQIAKGDLKLNDKSMDSIGIKSDLENGKFVLIPLKEEKYHNYDKIKPQCMNEANITKNKETVGGLNKLCYICSSIRKEGNEMRKIQKNEENDLTQNICELVVVDKNKKGYKQLTEEEQDMYCNCCGNKFSDPECSNYKYVDGPEFEFGEDS